MTRAVVLTPAAQADLDGIWDYTSGKWGEDQAVRYLRGLRDTCLDLAAGTQEGRPSDIRAGYHRCRSGSHILYFRITDTGDIVIVRILHQRMDARRHL